MVIEDMLLAYAREMEKISAKRGPVKQYERLKKIYEEGGHLFHGSHPKYMKSILTEKRLKPGKGTHGTGVYTWKGRPRSTYMRWPHSKKYPLGFPGIAMSRKQTKMGPTPHDPRPPGSVVAKGAYSERRLMEISEDPVDLPRNKSTYIVADKRQLNELRKQIKEGRFRQIDSRILHRLEADLQMQALDKKYGTDHYRPPTKKELLDLVRSKKPMPYIGTTRRLPATHKEFNNFYGQYDRMLKRKPEVDSKGNFDYFDPEDI